MTTTLFARQALTASGWRKNVSIDIDSDGKISAISDASVMPQNAYGVLLPSIGNLHSHSFQRAMAGLAEKSSDKPFDDFWTWRQVMYRFLELLTPEDVVSISAMVQMEMLESGYASVAEFHYLHHGPAGQRYDQVDEMSACLFRSAMETGIGYTHLPVLYTRGGLDNRALNSGQQRFGCSMDEFEFLHSTLNTKLSELPNDFVLGVAPHSLRAVSSEQLHLVSSLSNETPIHIHIAEQQNEVDEVSSYLGSPPVRWLLDNLDVNDRWCLIHATHANNDEIRDMANANAIAGLCPITEANLGDGIFDAKSFVEQNGRFGIGSDSNVKIALSEELRMLEVSQRLRDQRRVVLTDDTTSSNGRFLYERAALGGATALGRNSGAIQIGTLADLVALDDQHPMLIELDSDTILDTWIFASSDDIVTDVWAAGRHMVKAGSHIKHSDISIRYKDTISKLRKAL
ncbi:formimidoylglutamate deiminase [Arenicella sp. 4NH20-0111]|uniref:formimidoylglutamate deiminase n=1 Tax=Arenicella sp. 4NH20-0111 TaxID=3127648 RepID=UPI00310911E3